MKKIFTLLYIIVIRFATIEEQGYGYNYGDGMYYAAILNLNVKVFLEGNYKTAVSPSPLAISKQKADSEKRKAKSE